MNHLKKQYTMDLQLFAEQSATVDGEEWTIDDDREPDYASLDGEYEADEEGITIPDDEEEQPDPDDTDSDEDQEESDEEQEESNRMNQLPRAKASPLQPVQ